MNFQNHENQLKENCVYFAQTIEALSEDEFDTFIKNKVLTIRYVLNEDREYIGSQLLVAVGGPTIWVHTMNNSIHSTWGLSSFVTYYDNKGLDYHTEKIYRKNNNIMRALSSAG